MTELEQVWKIMDEVLNGRLMKDDVSLTSNKNVSIGRPQRCSLPKPKKLKLKYGDNIKFSFYGCTGECNHHDGVVVIASSVDNDKGVCYYGTAYCSPKDVYSKEKGKRIAYTDLASNLTTVALGKKTHHEINSRIFANIVANNDAPSWAREKVASHLVYHLENAFGIGGDWYDQ